MITVAYLFRYRIKEFIQFIRNTLLIVNQHSPDQLRVKPQYQALSKLHQQLERTYKQGRSNELGQELAQLDAARDQAVVCLRMLGEGYSRHPIPAQRAAGQAILDCLSKYGTRLYDLNYSAETAVLKKIVHDMKTDPACVRAVQELRLDALVGEIRRANHEFERLFIQQLEASSQNEGPRVRELVERSAEAYRTLVQHVEAHALLTPSSEYTLFGHHLNENIEHFNQIVARRKQIREAEAAEATPSPTDPTEEIDAQEI